MFIPLTAILISFITFIISFFVGKKLLHLEGGSLGVFLIGTIIMNTGFTLPFVIAAYGNEGIARTYLFSLGNGLTSYAFAYYLAIKYGSGKGNLKTVMKKFLLSPPLISLILAIILNLNNIKIPSIADNFLQGLGVILTPLTLLALGIYFSPRIIKMKSIFSGIFIRMFFGLALGFMFVKIFNLEGLNRLFILISSAAPIGYNTLTFSSLENLDNEFAASLVSISILIGLIYTPILIFILK